MLAPEKNWWKPMGRMEKSWLTVAFVWCVFLTVMMLCLSYGHDAALVLLRQAERPHRNL